MKSETKNIEVNIIPSCISYNRELQYISMIQEAYINGKLPDKAEIIEETENNIVINYYR